MNLVTLNLGTRRLRRWFGLAGVTGVIASGQLIGLASGEVPLPISVGIAGWDPSLFGKPRNALYMGPHGSSELV